jgi:hypothetical protein
VIHRRIELALSLRQLFADNTSGSVSFAQRDEGCRPDG